MTAMRCPYCRGTGQVAGVDTGGHWREELKGCPECYGYGCVENSRQWLRAWWRSPAETPLQKVVSGTKGVCTLILVGGMVLLLWDGVRLMDRVLAPSHPPEWVTQADPTDDDVTLARAIVANAKAEVDALPKTEKREIDREDATMTLGVAEGLSTAYDTARRNRMISPDALNRAEDVDSLAFQQGVHTVTDDAENGEYHREFSQSDYEKALISYTASALAAAREVSKAPAQKGFFQRLWDWL